MFQSFIFDLSIFNIGSDRARGGQGLRSRAAAAEARASPTAAYSAEKNKWLGCWPLVEISKHKQANSTSLAYNQKPQPQLQQNGQAVVLGQWQNFQPSNLAGPAGRPSPNVEISATVQAPLLGHIVAAMVVASD